MEKMRLFFLVIFVCIFQSLFAQNATEQEGLRTMVIPVDTMNIAQGISAISIKDTVKKDSVVKTPTDSLRTQIMQLFDQENIDYNNPISETDTIIVELADSIAQVDSLQQVKDTIVTQEVTSPENISLSNTTLIENKIYKNKLKDVSIENSTIITLIIEDSQINTASISSCTITKLIIKSSNIDDFLIEDSAIGELIIENSYVKEFETDNAFIKKQVINTGASQSEETE